MDPLCYRHRNGYINCASRSVYTVWFLPLIQEKITSNFGEFSFPQKIDNCIAFSKYYSGKTTLSVLVEIIVFSPYFRIRIPLFSISWDQALDLLVSVSCTHYCAYTSDLSTLLSARGLTTLRYGISYLEVSFTLRCFQRLSHPHFATLPCRWRDNRCTIGAFIPVLSY